MTAYSPTQGVLLLNLGTPDSPAVADVRRYLAEFLADRRVIDIHPVARWLLLHGIILRFRPRRSAAAYAEVWTEQGSPLLVHGRALTEAVQARLQGQAEVRLAMRYGNPSIAEALDAFAVQGIDRVAVLPLFPQYSSATTGSAMEACGDAALQRWNVPVLQFIGEHPQDPGYINALAETLRPALDKSTDRVVLSFHGLPERHIRRGDPSAGHCLADADCCASLGAVNRRCYRAQCFATARALQAAVGLPDESVVVCFQSRLGRTPWIGPDTEAVLAELGAAKLGRVVVMVPSFVADCLETLEEIALRGRDVFTGAGGGEFELLPCLNASLAWVDAVEGLLRRQVPGLAESIEGSGGEPLS